jgi:hypothetical protein
MRLQPEARGRHQGSERGQGTKAAESGGRQGASHDDYPSFGVVLNSVLQHTNPDAVKIREL